MIFEKHVNANNANCKATNFIPKIGETALEIVNNYKYLGIVFTNNGSFDAERTLLEKKAKKALFGMHGYLRNCILPLDTCINLFERLIQLIALFGSEIWAPFCINLSKVIKGKCSIFSQCLEFPSSKIILKFGKRLLQVHEKSVNLAVLGEV
jgi:hypothetical protein